MHKFQFSAAAIALLATSLAAQQITVPAVFANAEAGTTGNVWRAGLNRIQCFYDSSNFTSQDVGQPITITSVDFRLAGALATNIINYPSVEIHLQNSAVDFLAPSTTFATNRSVALGTPNFAGAVNTVAVSGTTPNDYFISIPLSTPFTYLPEAGVDLLMEIVILAAPTPVLGNTVSAAFSAAAHSANSVRSVNSTTAVTGTRTLPITSIGSLPPNCTADTVPVRASPVLGSTAVTSLPTMPVATVIICRPRSSACWVAMFSIC